jgi:hypothetical protein
MSKDQVEQPEIPERPVSAVGDAFEKFLRSHIAAGHRIQMCLDPKGNFFSFLNDLRSADDRRIQPAINPSQAGPAVGVPMRAMLDGSKRL